MCRKYGVQKTLTSIHECAHADVADACGCEVWVELTPTGSLHGSATISDLDVLDDVGFIAINLAGRLGEFEAARLCSQIENGDQRHGTSYTDLKVANARLSTHRRIHGPTAANRLKGDALARAGAIVRRDMARIVSAAAELLRAGRLSVDETKAALRQGNAPGLRNYRMV